MPLVENEKYVYEKGKVNVFMQVADKNIKLEKLFM